MKSTRSWCSICLYLFSLALLLLQPIDAGYIGSSALAFPAGRVKRIVTQFRHQKGRARAYGASVEGAEELRRQLIALFVLLRRGGGFSNSQRAWTQHDINLTTHLVAAFYLLKESGFRSITSSDRNRGDADDRLLVDFMSSCFSIFSEQSSLIQLPPKSPTPESFTLEEADDFLRDVTATFFILLNGGNVLTHQPSLTPEIEEDVARRLRAHYAGLLSQSGGLKLPFKGCGENQDQTDRDWPWMVALLSNRHNWRLFCGAVLINEWFVMTAAHCLNDKTPADVTVRLGEYNFREPSRSRTDHAAEAIFLHEAFNNTSFDNDIALIQLREKANLHGTGIWPICLPPSWLHVDNRDAFVAGWGKTSVGGQPSEVLLDAYLPVWSKDECEELFRRRRDPIDYRVQFCAGPKDGGEDACDGDSGGPLMYKMDSGRWAAIGIVSWGIDGRCAVKGEPGVYTRVSAYTEWIYSKMNI